MANPFGDEPTSVIAFREKVKQLEFQITTQSQTISKIRQELEEAKAYNKQLEDQKNELEQNQDTSKQELLTYKKLAQERGEKLNTLENSVDAEKITKLQNDAQKYKEQIEGLQSIIARNSIGSEEGSSQSPVKSDEYSTLMNFVTPLLMHEIDQDNEKYKNALTNIVEYVIRNGDIIGRIVAILYKYGGSAPLNRVRDMINNIKEFNVAIDLMNKDGIVNIVDDKLILKTSKQDVKSSSVWDSIDNAGLFEKLSNILENDSAEEVEEALDKFMDVLTERGFAPATIFFEIRKTKEGILKGKISRKDAIETVKGWKIRSNL